MAAIGVGMLSGVVLGCEGRVPDAVPAGLPPQAVSGPAAPLPAAEVAASLRARLGAGTDPWLGAHSASLRTELSALYAPGSQAPLWTDPAGRPTDDARAALSIFAQASSEGLDPADYGGQALARLAATLETGPAGPADVATFDVAMSAGALRYFRHLHLGRVDPRAVGFRLVVPAETHDFVSLLRSALAEYAIPRTAASLAPTLGQYDALRRILARYRALAEQTRQTPPPAPAAPLKPGERRAGLEPLRQRLIVLGDLAPDTPALEGDAYDGPLVDGVKRFQARHGLEPDGVLGRGTRAALDVPLAWRARQIELALERLRWLPDADSQRVIALNIPMFRFWGWDAPGPGGPPAVGMRAIVGRALSTQTPVFVGTLRSVIFRPYWNVPRSILLTELLPILNRDPGYLGRQSMEIVAGQGDDARPVPATTETLAQLRDGALRLRQRPGPGNALGLIKFDFPNDDNVYMHGTPAQALFSRARRDFSHGCVRVEDPVALAEWVLHDDTTWTRDRVLAATTAAQSQRVDLTEPIRVILFYTTAAVLSDDGRLHFAEDIYRHDARLDRTLAQVRPRVR